MAAQTPVPGCTHHPGKGFVYVCKTCNNDLICMDCVLDRHNKHELGSLTEYVSKQTHLIQQYEEQLTQTDIPKLERDLKENEKKFKENSKEIGETIHHIKRQGEQMKNDIDKFTDRLVKLCTDLEKLNSDIKENNKTVLTKYLREKIRPQLDRCKGARTSGTTDDVIAVAEEIRNRGPDTTPTITAFKSVVFKPGIISNAVLDRMLGTVLVDGENQSFRPVPPCKIISSFRTSFPYSHVRTCRTGDDREAWLSFWKDEQIYRVDQQGNIKKNIKCKVKVISITVSPTTGRVWFCVKEDKSIREITSDGGIVIRFNVESVPLSLCITQEDMVVVGTEWNGIVLYTSDGRKVVDGDGRICRQEAVIPRYMAYCTNTGDVAASDSDNVTFEGYMAGKVPGKQPRLIVMDKHLKLKFQCRYIDGIGSQTGGSQQSKFYPYDVCFDRDGDVLVADEVTRSVLLIDGNTGHYLRTVYISDGVSPLSISLQGDSMLWISHFNSDMKVFKYLK
ncbi:uncharacterized protein [Argopecten irradians]|uniref:uncharacterized protein n=1 Tax=Argopecten irradians TaxID=31199 RepID=UPI00371DF6B8